MPTKYQTLRGTHDILPDVVHRWQHVERVARDTFGLYGFSEIRTPIIEATELFARSVGETSDIVRKEMYTLERGDESITLRPENTAAVVRSVVEQSMHRDIAGGYPLKLFYTGPMFRYERPQAGRQRQFHQIGVEVIGAAEPAADAETLRMLERFLDGVGVGERELVLNSLGDPAERVAYRGSAARLVDASPGCGRCRSTAPAARQSVAIARQQGRADSGTHRRMRRRSSIRSGMNHADTSTRYATV